MDDFIRLADNISDGVIVTDENLKIIYCNRTLSEISGYSADEVLNQTPAMFQSGWTDDEFYKEMWNNITSKGFWAGRIIDRNKKGQAYETKLTIIPMYDEEKNVRGYIGITTQPKTAGLSDNENSVPDPLTGLPSRYQLHDILDEITVKKFEGVLVLFLIDIDDFSIINKNKGYIFGDKVLVGFSKLLNELFAGEHKIFRLFENTFGILAQASEDDEAEVKLWPLKILEALEVPVFIENEKIKISASIGASVYPHDSSEASSLVNNAEHALLEVKKAGKHGFRFYSAKMGFEWGPREKIENILQKALENNEFKIFYQPKVDAKNRKMIGMEALLRWENSEMGMVSPVIFIPLLENSGQIIEVGQWVLEQSLAFCHKLDDKNIKVSVNVSGYQLQQKDFYKVVSDNLAKSKISPHQLELEVTESILMKNMETAIENLQQIKNLGVDISIDDFGTGYSSFSYLGRLPVNRLKIDKSFVTELSKPEGRSIVAAIVGLASNLNMDVIAEGVETEDEMKILQYLSCEKIQGFYYSEPLPDEKFLDFMRNFA